MSIEQFVRTIHAFRSQIEEFRKQASPLTQNELEILMAKLADMMAKEKTEPAVLDKKFKGVLLNDIYELRTKGVVPSVPARMWLAFSDVTEVRISRLAGYKFSYPIPLREETIVDWARGTPDTWRRLMLTSGS